MGVKGALSDFLPHAPAQNCASLSGSNLGGVQLRKAADDPPPRATLESSHELTGETDSSWPFVSQVALIGKGLTFDSGGYNIKVLLACYTQTRRTTSVCRAYETAERLPFACYARPRCSSPRDSCFAPVRPSHPNAQSLKAFGRS
eukprot:3358964-Pleurochrysis_carterae.AAC.1